MLVISFHRIEPKMMSMRCEIPHKKIGAHFVIHFFLFCCSIKCGKVCFDKQIGLLVPNRYWAIVWNYFENINYRCTTSSLKRYSSDSGAEFEQHGELNTCTDHHYIVRDLLMLAFFSMDSSSALVHGRRQRLNSIIWMWNKKKLIQIRIVKSLAKLKSTFFR